MTPEQIEQRIGHRLPEHSMNLLLQLIAEKVQTVQSSAQEHVATVVDCGNMYAQVKLTGSAWGTTEVGDKFYAALQVQPPRIGPGMTVEQTMAQGASASGLTKVGDGVVEADLIHALSLVVGCFEAAESEGLSAALANTTDEHLKDLVERRLMYALLAAKGEYHGG